MLCFKRGTAPDADLAIQSDSTYKFVRSTTYPEFQASVSFFNTMIFLTSPERFFHCVEAIYHTTDTTRRVLERGTEERESTHFYARGRPTGGACDFQTAAAAVATYTQTHAKMGKTAKRQNRKAATQAAREATVLGTRATKPTKVSAAAAAASASSDAMATGMHNKKASGTSLGRISRAVEADLVQEACVALDTLLAEVERGERADAAPLALCSRVLSMCQKAGGGGGLVQSILSITQFTLHSIPFHSIPFHSIPFHSIPFTRSLEFRRPASTNEVRIRTW